MAIETISGLSQMMQGLTNVPKEEENNQNFFDSFGSTLKNELNKVNELQRASDEATRALATGEATDVAEVLITASEAKLALDLTIQVNNKLVEAYQEIMRMQM